MTPPQRRLTPGRIALIAAAAIGLVNMVLRVAGQPGRTDFQLFWLAGRMWRAGGDPYGADYQRLGVALLGDWSSTMTWVYPPHFLPVALIASLAPMRAALLGWNVTGVALLVGGGVLLGRSFAVRPGSWVTGAAAMIAYVGLSTASGSALRSGQMAYLILAGIVLVAWSVARRRPAAGAIGMAILMLKPQIGIVLCCTVPFLPGGVRMALLGAALAALATLPALAIGGVGATIGGFLRNVADYRNIAYNLPAAMTGLANPIQAATGRDLPAIPLSLAACMLCLAAMAWLRRRSAPFDLRVPKEAAAAWLILSLGAVAGLVSLHVYDLVILSPLVALLPRLGRRGLALLGPPLALLLRPENVARLIHAGDARVAAVGGLTLMAGALALMAAPLKGEDRAAI